MQTPFAPYEDFLEFTLHKETPPEFKLEVNGGTLRMLGRGAIQLDPNKPKTKQGLILSAGIHGNETAPIELINLLVNRVLVGDVSIHRPTLLLLGHPDAMEQNSRFLDFNMNRLFCGAHSKPEFAGSRDSQRASKLEDFVESFFEECPPGLHLDLHTAIRDSRIERFALKPFVDLNSNDDLNRDTQTILKACGIEALVFQHSKASTFSSHTAITHRAESYTLELGKVRPFGENNLEAYSDVSRCLQSLIEVTDPEKVNRKLTMFNVCYEIIVPDASFQLHVSESEANFAPFKKGQCIWSSDHDRYEVRAEEERLIFPNAQVPVGQRAGLMLVTRPS